MRRSGPPPTSSRTSASRWWPTWPGSPRPRARPWATPGRSSPAPPAPPRRKRRRWRRWASAWAGPPAAPPCSSARSCGAADPAPRAASRGAPPPRLPARWPGWGIMTAPARPGTRPRGRQGAPDERPGAARPLAVTGAIAACAVMVTGLVILTPLVLVGWIAAPHAGLGLPGVLRTATGLWLAAHHVGFALRGAGRIGMLPLGLVLIPGSLLWRAGQWVVRTAQLSRLSEVGYAALALAAPYAVLCGALALASRSPLAVPSLPQAVVAGFLIALCAGGLGGARALAPWDRLARLLPPRPRSVVLGTAGSVAVLVAAGAILAGASLAVHLREFGSLNDALGAGAVGSMLLLLAQLAYVPNAVIWAVCFTLGPGF